MSDRMASPSEPIRLVRLLGESDLPRFIWDRHFTSYPGRPIKFTRNEVHKPD